MRARVILGVAAGAVALVLSTAPAVVGAGDSQSTGPRSIVQLGDSIASGEGTLYGYRYDASSREWVGGDIDASWPGPYPGCHDSPDAYGTKVATYFDARFAQFACTGATFPSGIRAPEVYEGREYRPAEFGDWERQTDLNPEYDQAAPDLVLITFGADDVNFVGIVESCVKNGYEHSFDLADLECTRADPGTTVKRDFVDVLPTLEENYVTLVRWIEDRAEANGQPEPKIVFTTYPDPLPPRGEKCPDSSWLDPKQVRYLATLVDRMSAAVTETVERIDQPNVAVADLSRAYVPNGVDHRWCSDAPWAYGLSIYQLWHPSSFESQAPFHPTPEGQSSIASHVIPVVRRLFE